MCVRVSECELCMENWSEHVNLCVVSECVSG